MIETPIPPFMVSDRPRDNAAKITSLLEERPVGQYFADLYRSCEAGPSGQRRDLCVGRVWWRENGPYEFRIVTPDHGETAGYAVRQPGAPLDWTIFENTYDDGIRLRGWATSLSLGVDVLVNGEHAATGRHDSRRRSGGRWQRYVPKPWPLDDDEAVA